MVDRNWPLPSPARTSRGASCSSSVSGRARSTVADLGIAGIVADGAAAIISGARQAVEVSHLLHRADALRRVASDIGSRLDLDRILSGLVDHAMALFEGDRAAVFLRHDDGQTIAEVSRGLSTTFLASVRSPQPRSLPTAAIAARRPLFAVDYPHDPRGADVRAAVVQEGFDTLCTAPLLDGTEVLGLLNIYHDQPHHWTDEELETIAALAAAGERRHPRGAGLRAHGDLGGAAPVDPAARAHA